MSLTMKRKVLSASDIPSSFVKVQIPRHIRRSWSSTPDVPIFKVAQKENKDAQRDILLKRRRSSSTNTSPESQMSEIQNLRLKADSLLENKKYAEAEQAYDDAIKRTQANTERTLVASLNFNLAVCLLKQKKYEHAIKVAEMAIKFEPTFANAHYALGYALFLAGRDMHRAIRSFRDMMKLRPNVRIALPQSGQPFGPKGSPTLYPADVLIIFNRPFVKELPLNWAARESRSQPGKIFYENLVTRETTWVFPILDKSPENKDWSNNKDSPSKRKKGSTRARPQEESKKVPKSQEVEDRPVPTQ